MLYSSNFDKFGAYVCAQAVRLDGSNYTLTESLYATADALVRSVSTSAPHGNTMVRGGLVQ